MSEKITAVKGMNDILPADSAEWERLEALFRTILGQHGYRNLRTPIVEPTGLFVRGLGEVTDIVEKEMYSFEDKLNGEHLTLRPEATAGVVRAVTEHNLLYEGGQRLYYSGPMFRHERPQRGRYRQFHQMGAEALGFPGAEIDAELILMAHRLWQALDLDGIELQLNSLGQPEERQRHREALIAHLSQHQDDLDEDARRRLHSNPLRILDTKNPALQAVVEAAPKLLDFLGPESLTHFETVKAILDAHGIAYRINPRLVRGMDYYNLTVFEFVTQQLGSQGTICGGGRYDHLFTQLGAKPAPAVGWAMGVERVLELVKEQNKRPSHTRCDAYVIVTEPQAYAQLMPVLTGLRSQGLSVVMHAAAQSGAAGQVALGSMKSQFKKADASGATYALIVGPDEWQKGELSLKNLRDPSATQQPVAMQDWATWASHLKS
jgi:histidyl-tRNA synthetase